jgi:hypothetical protein
VPFAYYQRLTRAQQRVYRHLDYELLRLPDSFHTEGFYRRESSLLRQLVGDGSPDEVTRDV